MGLIAALLPTPIQLARLRSAVGRRYSVVACTDWNDLARTCAREAVGMAVVDLYADGREGFRDLRQLRRQHPSISVVLYVALPPCRPHDLFEAGRFGVDGLALVDQDDSAPALLSVIEQAEARGITQTVRAALAGVRPTARDAALLTVTRAHQRLTPQQLASILGIRRRALAARLEAAGFPPPQQLITWGRLIVAAQLLEDTDRSADSVAAALDFPSGSAFRNSCRRYVGRSPLEIRRDGGARCVIGALVDVLAARRSERAASRFDAAPAAPAAPELATPAPVVAVAMPVA
ncbi:MAG TPA: helix-turn-helix domain-containing protein [Gemmatimonadaceae bacterium]|nr:helix-turn-helix domain-containing protein [Gemmatimonadaceae bacterium]